LLEFLCHCIFLLSPLLTQSAMARGFSG